MLVESALLTFIATAQPMPCVSVDEVKVNLRVVLPTAELREMGGTEAQAFIAAFNKIPPRSSLEADYIVTARVEGKPGVAVVLFQRGCAMAPFGMSVGQYRSLLGTI